MSLQKAKAAITRLLIDEAFCRDERQRIAAATEIVDALPATAGGIELILQTQPHRLSREVQYSVLNFLDFSTISEKHIRRLLPAVQEMFSTLDTEAAFVWQKLGCLLGDGWYQAASDETRVRIETFLAQALRTTRRVHGRRAALHGIEHVLKLAPGSRAMRLLDAVHLAALNDRARSVRASARLILRRGDPSRRRWARELQEYGRKPGRRVRR